MIKIFAYISLLFLSISLGACGSMAPSPKLQSAQNVQEAYTALGIGYLQKQDLERARYAFARVLESNPQHAQALQGMALIYQTEQESRLAETYFQQALKAQPEFTLARYNYGVFLYRQQKYALACAEFERASQDTFYPQRARIFENIGLCQLQRGRTQAAQAAFIRALQLEPQNSRVHLQLARLYSQDHDYVTAWKHFQHYYHLGNVDAEGLGLGIQIADALPQTPALLSQVIKHLARVYPDSPEYLHYKDSLHHE
ncbi:type IV pilus assembly protein PilF [Allopseudospirillum japonicum]|uniref:Type IV pilus assembly protein PilF n=1 Tax=Allopseudospirillum japonicum TaxID=64971 RepID=A0A1H6RP25_9GAMM|nr:type IV pilus biogenesis/stability protein PilW [Allopseudospirillum japonicum]SEI57501.1 type IV pilus assembly protein PilF [Allopseudospirillum japonicum]